MSTALTGMRLSRRARRALRTGLRNGNPSHVNTVVLLNSVHERDMKGSCIATYTTALAAVIAGGTYTITNPSPTQWIMTCDANGAIPAADTIALSVGDRVLLRLEAAALAINNALWEVVDLGDAGTPFILQRTDDANEDSKFSAGMSVYVEEGGTLSDTWWSVTTDNPIVVGTTAVALAQIPPGGAVVAATLAGTGGAGLVGILDAAAYYAGTDLEDVLTAIGAQLGGDTDATFNFTGAHVLTDDDAVYAALEKLDLKWGDLANTANTEGASLVGLEDAAANYAAADVEAALAELFDGTLGRNFNDGVAATFGTANNVSLSLVAARAALHLNRGGMALSGFNGLSDRFELKWIAGVDGVPGLLGTLDQVGVESTVIAGGIAGAHTVTGIAVDDVLVSVLHLDMGGNAETDLTSEFTISGANTINNAAGTDTSGDTLIVTYIDVSARFIADTDRSFVLEGTNAANTDVSFDAEGGITFTTAGADGDEMILSPNNLNSWGNVTWGTDKQVLWEATLELGANVTNYIAWAGLKLTNTEVKATDNDQVYFRYEDDVAAGNWEVVDSIGGVDVSTDTGVAGAIGQAVHLMLLGLGDRTVECYLNGALVHTTGALTAATDLIPFIGVAADGAAAAKALTLRGQAVSRVAG